MAYFLAGWMEQLISIHMAAGKANAYLLCFLHYINMQTYPLYSGFIKHLQEYIRGVKV